jgi:hypothetical protein
MPTSCKIFWASKGGTGSRWHLILLIRGLFLVALIGSFEMPRPAYAQDPTKPPTKRSVYVSNGYQPGIPWGGFHVTMTSFNPDLVSRASDVRQAWLSVPDFAGGNPFRLRNKKWGVDLWPVNHLGNNLWGVAFSSGVLHTLGDNLKKSKFNVKPTNKKLEDTPCGPKLDCYHISLYQPSPEKAKTYFDNNLRNACYWPFFVNEPSKDCEQTGANCPIWFPPVVGAGVKCPP